jgi:hypothetical protein
MLSWGEDQNGRGTPPLARFFRGSIDGDASLTVVAAHEGGNMPPFSHLLVESCLPKFQAIDLRHYPRLAWLFTHILGGAVVSKTAMAILVEYCRCGEQRFIFAGTHDTSRLDQLANGGLDGSLGARRRPQLHASIVEVKIDRSLGQSERLGYLPRCLAARDQG